MEENNEVIQKILKMMESFTEQIIQMKEINNLKWTKNKTAKITSDKDKQWQTHLEYYKM